ncbi:MAG: hypothetical protein JWM31_551, partial [Solirubrobacterales bacterium]|nr:hypothetical protein [Solirubrobacterales bacterium]
MATSTLTSPAALRARLPQLAPGDLAAVTVAALLLVWWAIQAFGEPLTLDVGLAYEGGKVAL